MKKSLLLGGAAMVCLLALGGVAQAQSAVHEIDEIIVTADRANRTLRETAASVDVTTADDARRRAGVYSTNDLLDRIPNIVSIEPGNDLPAVRGLDGTGPGGGATAFFAGSRPRLSYAIDGRTLSFNEATFANTSLWDVQQVEVFRGPQSTLQGRNAIAGVIAVKTVEPGFDWSGAARAIVGNRDEVQLSGAVGGPIAADLAAFRVTADWQREKSFVHFTPYPGVKDPDVFDNLTLRGKLLVTPAAGLRSLLSVSYQDAREPQSNWLFAPFDPHVPSTATQPVFRMRTTTGIADTTFDLAAGLTFQLYLSAADFRVDRYAVAGTGIALVEGREYVAQPILRYRNDGGSFSAMLGAYVFRTHQDETIDFLGGGAYRDETDTTAVYGEVTVRPAPALAVILGARYEEEKRYRVGTTGNAAIMGFELVTDFRETYKEFLPRATVSLDISDGITVGVVASKGYNAGGAGITLAPPFQSYSYAPEYVWNFEGFTRAKLTPTLLLTANLFYNRYKDIQLPYYFSPESTVIRNAERATTYGAEAGLSWRPSSKNELYANIGLLDTKVNRYDDVTVAGNALPRAPAFSLATGFSVSPDDRFELGADVRYTGNYFSDFLNDPRGKIGGYAVVNARVAYQMGPARLFFSARNLLNSGHPVQVFTSDVYPTYGVIVEPRKLSAGVELRF